MVSPVPFLLVALVVIAFILLLRPRRFYFIRHGETLLNAQHIKQGSEGSLSVNGEKQAEQVAAYLKRLPIECIISSPYTRAKETSAILNKALHVSVLYSPLLSERRNPSEVLGKSTRDPEVIRIVDEMDLAYHEDTYRYSDEENFIDMKIRARKCLNLLSRQGAYQTVVVTHHAFLKMLLAYMLYREGLHAGDFIKLSFFNTSDNGGVSVCEFNPLKVFSPSRGWRVISYNEQVIS
jgi:broad specificity phosphatase PhoE